MCVRERESVYVCSLYVRVCVCERAHARACVFVCLYVCVFVCSSVCVFVRV